MTSQPEFPINRALILGRLGSFAGPRDAGGARRPLKTLARRGDFGHCTRFLLELSTPLGEPFELTIEASPATEGMAVLDAAACGDDIAVDGTLVLAAGIDWRGGANDDGGAGREVRDLVVRASAIRTPAPGEQRCQAQAWLEGVVVEPATFARHATIRSAQFGRTLVRTMVGPHRLPYDVACAISTEHDAAGYLYRAGNRLQLRGDIARLVTLQSGPRVEQELERLRQEWADNRPALERATEHEQRKASWHYRSRHDQVMYQARTSVLIEALTPLSGAQPLSFAQARRARREFSRQAHGSGLGAARALANRPSASDAPDGE